MARSDRDQRRGVLGKARAAEARTGVQELRADAAVETHAARDLLHVGADLLAEIGHLVDEGDLGGEKRVGRVFDQLGGAPAGEHDRRLVDEQRPVELAHHPARPLVLGADHDAVRPLEVLDRRALAQEFRIRHHREIGVGAELADDRLDLVVGADRDGRFGHDDREAIHLARDLARRRRRRRTRSAKPSPRRDGVPTAMKHRVGGTDRRGPSRVVKNRRPGLDVALDQRLRPGSKIGIAPLLQPLDLGGVLVDAGDDMAEVGEAGPRHEPDIAGADHGYPHAGTLLAIGRRIIRGSRIRSHRPCHINMQAS